ncbi:MAG: flagellar biosynthesis protein FlhB [Acetivibrionales bacterium]|jgi:flagellar biosynthetic protein FlhB
MSKLLLINLQLFAAGGEDKTEKATPKKRREARKKGQILQSREVTSALILMLAFVTLRVYGKKLYAGLQTFTTYMLQYSVDVDELYTVNNIIKLYIETMMAVLKAIAPTLAVVVAAGFISGYAQVGFLFTTETLAFKLERLNPVSGLKRIFSFRSVVELLKACFKIGVIGYVAYLFIKGEANNILNTMDMTVPAIATYIAAASINLALRICAVLVVLGILDYGYQWWEYEKNLRMSKQELKEEYKQIEGNPEVKSKIKQKQRQISMRRMLQDVPKADVVITNPTHYAVALKYDANESEAPVVLAKGLDFMALRIKEVAKENRIETVENKPLARTLYETVDIGEVIPPELYQAVAEILAYVYSLKK